MAELTRRRLVINYVIGVFTLTALSIAIYFVGVGGGVDKAVVASLAIFTCVISIAAATWGTISYARNPTYRPNLNLNTKVLFWCAAPFVFWALSEIFALSSGMLLAILASILSAAGVPVSTTVLESLSWILLIIGMILAALFLRQAWKRFYAVEKKNS